ncbi:MAG: HpcH/HpaI aldolase/citrate lyase family protein [Rhodospirillaceae bacterium]
MNTAASGKHRSWLIVPASRPDDVERAAASGADVVVLDFVEFVAAKDKAAARTQVGALIDRLLARGVQVFVQTEPDAMDEDVAACSRSGLAGIVLARAESAEQVRELSAAIERQERAGLLPRNATAIVAALETARGNHLAYDIACASERVWGITLGRADLVMDLRPEPSGEFHLMPYLMQRLVIVAGAAGKVPLGAWWRAPDRGLLATEENTYSAAVRGRAIGFRGAMCLRPAQVDALNRAYA